MSAVASTTNERRAYLVGAAMVLAAGTMWSFGGITVRFAPDSDSWQYLIWRSVGLFCALEAASLVQGRGSTLARVPSAGWVGILGGFCMMLAGVAFVFALKRTSIANAIFLASITPLLSMLLARPILGEKLTAIGMLAVGIGIAGLLVMAGGKLGDGKLVGDIAALISSLGFAGYTICVRLSRGRDLSAMMPLSALMGIAVCVVATLINGRPLVPPAQDIAMALLHGAVFIGIGVTLFNTAAPHVPATGLAVLAQTETILSPIWAYLILGETPSATTLAGGCLILAGVMMTAVAGSRPRQKVTGPDAPL
jgi:drug/metabolite transporter (DMT)-like permease